MSEYRRRTDEQVDRKQGKKKIKKGRKELGNERRIEGQKVGKDGGIKRKKE